MNRKITVIGSHLCPDTLYALNRLTAAGVEATIRNVGRLGRDGMRETDKEIVKIMMNV